jgi:hypothetical protein
MLFHRQLQHCIQLLIVEMNRDPRSRHGSKISALPVVLLDNLSCLAHRRGSTLTGPLPFQIDSIRTRKKKHKLSRSARMFNAANARPRHAQAQ